MFVFTIPMSSKHLSEFFHPSWVPFPIASPLGSPADQKLGEHIELEVFVTRSASGAVFRNAFLASSGFCKRVFDALDGDLDEGIDEVFPCGSPYQYW